MTKKLEALKELKHWKETNNENGVVWLPLFAVENIEKALQRLEAIDNAKPSEALEYLEDLRKQVSFANSDGCIFDDIYDDIIKDIEIIKQYILKAQELETMANEYNLQPSQISEVLECLEIMRCNLPHYYVKEYNTIKQALIKAQKQEKEIYRLDNQCLDILTDYIRLKNKSQEQEKVLEIIFEKNVEIYWLKHSNTVEEYNKHIKNLRDTFNLTQEEFDLLKRKCGE